ncbi:MAG: ATP-dependent 6-phosphofructokinase [Deltaproteobacteria bacterium]|nr:ATP-dependent 6-phosphofructokinase [Deltaproteobacteria bacterium]
MSIRRIGVLTGGGDAPGLNPALKALVYKATGLGVEVIGLRDGWQGLLNEGCEETLRLEDHLVRRWDRDGGTNLGSSRTNPFRAPLPGEKTPVDRSAEVLANIERLQLDALIALGGEDTLGVANKLFHQHGSKIVGIPKTIDNDLSHTDYSLGFDTALRNCMHVVEQVRTPAGSHHWVQVVEVMGRHSGHLALWGSIAGGATMALIPEHPFSYDHVYKLLTARLERGERDRRYPRYAVIVVAEGATAVNEGVVTVDTARDAFGHERLGGIGTLLSERIRRETDYDSRAVIIGHAQRGGSPSAIDRIMGRLFGSAAVEAVMNGDFGKMVSAHGIAPACRLSMVPLSHAVGKLKKVDVDLYYDTARYAAKL